MSQECPIRQPLLDCRGHALVIGGPGSGKTTLALRKAVKRIKEGLAPGQSVLFLSFSRAAIARIIEASKLEAKKGERELLDTQTFHSFFWDLLRSHLYLLGAPRRLQILFPHDERALSSGITEKDTLLWDAWIAERERRCFEDGRVAFDLFAPKAAQLLTQSAHLRSLVGQRHPLIIVDEAQDTNPHAWTCIKLLAQHSQILCLADVEQQIFDYLPGIDPKRIEDIKSALSPLCIDLGSDNFRSPGSEIAAFGQDILANVARNKPYIGVSKLPYNWRGNKGEIMRIALGALQRNIKKRSGEYGRSVAILVPSGSSAAKLSAAMNDMGKPIRHKLLFDEAEALLAARFAAFLLEPRNNDSQADLLTALELMAAIKRSNGPAGAKNLDNWAKKVAARKIPRAGLVGALQSLLAELTTSVFTGDPARDWIRIKAALRITGERELWKVVRHLDYLVAFKRGKRIGGNLASLWQRDGQYAGARDALDRALAQDQLLDGIDDPRGVQVMTIHKAKGKQFDGVIILREQRHTIGGVVSSLVWNGDPPPHPRSRKILRVAVTRARTHTLILDPVWPRCPLISPHRL